MSGRRLSIRIPVTLARSVEQVMSATRMSESQLVREALREFCAERLRRMSSDVAPQAGYGTRRPHEPVRPNG